MPVLDLNRTEIQRARAELARQRERQRTAAAGHAQALAEYEAGRQAGAASEALARRREHVEELARQARAAAAASGEMLGAIAGLSEALLQRRDPGLMVGALSAAHPVMLLPVALQTRYDDATTRLMVRIYPDVLHGFDHEPGLTDSEVEAGKRYWQQRFADPDDTQSPWTEIARGLGPMRAAYVVRTLMPTNGLPSSPDDPLAEPAFDEAAIPRAAAASQQVFATALPDRFVVVGYRGGVEVLRKWGAAVADLLALSPLFDPLLVDNPENHDPFGGARAWMVDYPAAVAAGMAITVTEADLKPGTRLADGLDRMVVLGVDWTQTPQSAAELVAELLDNHQHGDGLKFVAQGTPTNNTGAARAGYAANGSDVEAALNPAVADAQAAAVADELASAGARLQMLLGLPPGRFDAGQVPGADLMEGATAGHMLNALWNATLGYTLRYFWNPLDAAGTLIDDASIEQLRAWSVRFLRPGGPLSALRVGNQPYGILPVAARGFVPQPNSPLERELLEALQWFRRFWERAQRNVPTLRDTSAQSLHQVLAMQPWAVAKRFWQVVGPAAIANYPDIKEHAVAQGMMLSLLVDNLLERRPFSSRSPFLAACAVRPKAHSMDAVPWVQRDPAHPRQELDGPVPLARDYIGALRDLLSRPTESLRAPLTAMQDGEALLEALLAFAADEELLHSGRRLFSDHLDKSPLVSAEVKLRAKNMRYAEYTGVDVSTQVGDQFDLGHAAAVLDLQLVGTTGQRSVEAFIGSQLGLAVERMPEHMRNIAGFRDSLAFLQQRTAGELSLALRTTLDLYAHRLDAWITSLATRRLDRMRESQPQGLHIGAFGVVENLLPDSARPADQAADSLGYVHAPSLQQATTAAILRSGHVANRQAAGNAFDIDLRSHRVKRARRLLEGVANGQSMAALLGYRFERGLRDAQPTLARHILELRRAYPLRPAGETAGDEAKEDIAARDVVDGVRLVAEYRAKGVAAIAPAVDTAADRPRVAAVADELIDLMDSVSDLLIAESVHQMVGGNMDGAGAAMMTLDKQTRPPEPRVVETPHATRGYTQRVVVALQPAGAGPWSALTDLASQVEPALDAWLARLLGDPVRYAFGARVLDAVKDPQDAARITGWVDSGETLQVGLGELGMSALSVVLGSEAQQGSGRSAFQERLARVLGQRAREAFGAAAANKAVVLEAEGAGEGDIGLVAFESFAWLLRRLIDKARPLRRMDMVLARDGTETRATLDDGEFAGVDLADLGARVGIAEAGAAAALQALGDALAALPEDAEALAALDPAEAATQALIAGLQGALSRAYALGWRSALPSQQVSEQDDIATGDALAPQDSLPAAAARARALRDEVRARLDAAPPPQGTERAGEQARLLLERAHAILGKSFPLLPRFNLGAYAGEAAAALAERDMLLGKGDLKNDDLVIAGWLPKLGCVREATGLLADVLSAAEAMGHESLSQDFKLLQYPRPNEGTIAHWGALPRAEGHDLRGVVAVVAHAPEALAGIAEADALSGLFVDEWMESIPSDKETTGISFHFDAPGARAPQSVLLAVPADPAAEHWTLEALLDTVDEALALSRLRAVRPQDLQGLGLVLPGIFLSSNYKHDVPSVDFSQLIAKNLAVLRASGGMSSEASVMKMTEGKTFLTE